MAESQSRAGLPVDEPLVSIAGIVEWTGLGRSTIERLKSSGRLPRPDLTVCRSPRWKAQTIRRWIEEGGSR